MNYRALFLAAGILGPSLGARAEAPPLARQSPFGRDFAGDAQISTAPTLELRGIMSTPDGFQYCIFDSEKKSSVWVSPDDGGNPFLVKSGNPARDEVTLEVSGRLMTLRLREAKVASAPVELAALPPAAAGLRTPAAVRRRQPGEPRAPRENTGP
jgi:hypothetical protein